MDLLHLPSIQSTSTSLLPCGWRGLVPPIMWFAQPITSSEHTKSSSVSLPSTTRPPCQPNILLQHPHSTTHLAMAYRYCDSMTSNTTHSLPVHTKQSPPCAPLHWSYQRATISDPNTESPTLALATSTTHALFGLHAPSPLSDKFDQYHHFKLDWSKPQNLLIT